MPNQLTFNSVNFNLIERENQFWLSGPQIAAALGYKSEDSISRIYRRNYEEFTPCMTETVKMTASGNLKKEIRIFSLRGAHLIAMFSRTKVAKEFRKWVLDILDKETHQNEIPQPQIPKTMRMLLVMEQGHVVSSQVVPVDCVIFPLSKIPDLLREPGYFSGRELENISKVALELAVQQSKAGFY